MHKSPFFIIEEFISPLTCEELIDVCSFTSPDTDKNQKYVKTQKTCDRGDEIVYDRLVSALPTIQQYFDIQYKGTERVIFEWFPEGSSGELISENSTFLRGKWLRDKQRDLTGILFLSDYQDVASFDQEYEVYGGKLEFIQHQFGFNPKRGTLIIYPSAPHFINKTADIQIGNLFQARIQIAAKTPFLYNPDKFPGNYTTWFKDLK